MYSKFVYEPKIAFETREVLINNANAFIAGPSPWLTALLQSRLMWFLLRMRVTRLQNGYFQLMNENLDPLPIVSPGSQSEAIDGMVLELASGVATESRTCEIEADLNQLVYHIYGMNEDESQLIENWYEQQDSLAQAETADTEFE